MADLPQYPDVHHRSSSHNPVETKLSHGERRERKFLLYLLAPLLIALVYIVADASRASWKLILIFYTIGSGVLLLMAWYIVYSYKKEKGAVHPYDRDHIVK